MHTWKSISVHFKFWCALPHFSPGFVKIIMYSQGRGKVFPFHIKKENNDSQFLHFAQMQRKKIISHINLNKWSLHRVLCQGKWHSNDILCPPLFRFSKLYKVCKYFADYMSPLEAHQYRILYQSNKIYSQLSRNKMIISSAWCSSLH